MKSIRFLAGNVQEVTERSTLAKLVWFVGMAYLFLWVPDIDLIFLGILHHRSIVTHSILPAVFLLMLGRRAGAAPLAGAMIGLAAHLSCDLLSPAVGFGQIWLPAPIKTPIGPLTYPWLFANALIAFWIARWLAMKAFNVWAGYSAMLIVSVITALSYGVFNENSILSNGVTLVVFFFSLIGSKKTLAKDPDAAGKMKATAEAVTAIRQNTIAGLDRFSETMASVSSTIGNHSDDMVLRNKFRNQQDALTTIYSTAQKIVRHERKLASVTPAVESIYNEIGEVFEPAGGRAFEGFTGLEDDLLELTASDVIPRQTDDLKALQTAHQLFMRNLKEVLLEDADIQAKFSDLMLKGDAQKLLANVMSSGHSADSSS